MSALSKGDGAEKKPLSVPKLRPPDAAPDGLASNKRELKPPWQDGDQKPVGEYEPRCLDPAMFPDKPKANKAPPTTIANVRYLLDQHGIVVRYNLVQKKLDISIPGVSLTVDNAENAALSHVISLAALNFMSTTHIPDFLIVIGDQKAYNPVADWICSRPWDGEDRLPAFYDTLTAKDDFPDALKKTLMRKWLLSVVAAALSTRGFKCRGVLTLQGLQNMGKTSWGKNLINDEVLADAVIKTDHHLDAGNKDSLITAISHAIVEIGELDSSFKRDIARLKGFLTAESDKVRRPFGRGNSEYARRTVFYATVNQSDFLVDTTGNSRWWTVPVVAVDYDHGIDMQQLFAQLNLDFENKLPWWLTPDEEAQLAEENMGHQAVSVIRDQILDYIDLDYRNEPGLEAMTATQLLNELGIKPGNNPQARECGHVLRQLLGEPKKINGQNKWRIPVRGERHSKPEPGAIDEYD